MSAGSEESSDPSHVPSVNDESRVNRLTYLFVFLLVVVGSVGWWVTNRSVPGTQFCPLVDLIADDLRENPNGCGWIDQDGNWIDHNREVIGSCSFWKGCRPPLVD